jgi:peptide deformylase
MNVLLKILQAGHPVLRADARALTPEEITSKSIAGLIDLMRDTMRDAPGVGLAAPQIGEAIQLVVIEDGEERMAALSVEERKRRDREPVPFHVLINPQLEIVDPEPIELYEGCLSVGGFYAVVPRAKAVRVTALDHRGAPVTIDAHGWYARILQHEIDHLRGTLCIDRMAPRTFTTVDNLARYVR